MPIRGKEEKMAPWHPFKRGQKTKMPPNKEGLVRNQIRFTGSVGYEETIESDGHVMY